MSGPLVALVATIRPAPQGSHTPVVTPGSGGGRARRVVDPATGRVVTYGKQSRPRVFMKDSSPGLEAYREAVALSARSAVSRAGLVAPLSEPVATVLTFEFPRPKNGRAWPDSRATGDVDKLERAVHDALTTARVIDDDARIVAGLKWCRFVDEPIPGRTRVQVWGIDAFMEEVGPAGLTLNDI